MQAEVNQLEAHYHSQGWTERPHSQLAKHRHRLASAQKRASRAWRDLEKRQAASLQQRLSPHQEQFALFGANFVRWAVAWVKDLLSQANQNFKTTLEQVKTLVRTVSRTRARWIRNALGNTLIFDETGPFAGTVIRLSGWVTLQLQLRLFNFAPS